MSDVTIKKLSSVSAMRERNRVIKMQVMQCCGITEEHYNAYLFETGITWIKEKVWDDESVVTPIASSSFFWAWFKNQWYMRENDFLADYIVYILTGTEETKKYLRYWWYDLHRVDLMKTYPSGEEWTKLTCGVFRKEAPNA